MPDEQNGLNQLGQVAYLFELADHRQGIATWTPIPEPSALVLFALGGPLLIARRRRAAS